MLISFKEKGEIQSIHNVNDTTPPPLTDVATFGFFKTSTRKKKQNRGKRMKIKVISTYDITYKGIFYVNHLLYCIVKLAKKGIRQLLVLSLDYGNLRFKSVI